MKLGAGTFARISKAAALDRRLSSEAFRVLGVLCCYADNTTARCHPSVAMLADHLGLTRRMVQLHLRRLEELGYIATTKQMRSASAVGLRRNGARMGGGDGPNSYVLAFPIPPSLKRADRVESRTDGAKPHFTPSHTDGAKFGDTDGAKPHFTQTILVGTRLGFEERNSLGEDSASPVGVREEAGGGRGEAGFHPVEDAGTDPIVAGPTTAPVNGKLPWRTPTYQIIELGKALRGPVSPQETPLTVSAHRQCDKTSRR